MEVASNGDLANWQVPGEKVTGMGGAMDLVSGAKKVICLMTHTDKSGGKKLVDQCTLPITGLSCVHAVVTDVGVFVVDAAQNAFVVTELADGHTFATVEAMTGGKLIDGRR
jgi:3-oxoacid CoA-transferase subunit B